MKDYCGFKDYEDFKRHSEAYKKVVGAYIEQDGGFAAAGLGEVFAISMDTFRHSDNFRLTRDLVMGLLSLLTDPTVSSRLSSHLRDKSGPLLTGLLFLFEESPRMENALDFLSLDHDFSKEWLEGITEKYTRLYNEAGLKMPDINL